MSGRAGAGGVAALLLAACGSGAGPASRAPDPPAGAGARYEVVAGPGARELAVQVAFPAGIPERLAAGDGASPFVRDVEVDGGGGFHPVAAAGGSWPAAGCAARPCRVRYRFLLADAARAGGDLDVARDLRGALEAPPSTWLLAPEGAAGAYRLHVAVPPGLVFVSGLPLAAGAPPDTYEGDLSDLSEAPYAAFGLLRARALPVAGGGTVEVAIAPGPLGTDDALLTRWVSESARAVATYYGRYPVPRVLLLLLPSDGRTIGNGMTMGDGGSSIVVNVGAGITAERLDGDWVLTHEMFHLGFPTLPRRHHWLEEGIATYVEPLARARIGRLAVEEVWQGMLEGLPHGEPEEGDAGLDFTPTWGRTYWGGALFCLVADVSIRERSGNARSLDDALRAILVAGGSGAVRWPLGRTLATGDAALGAPYLQELHAKMGSSPAPVDLPALFRRLGVALQGDRVIFDDAAPLAAVRLAMTAPASAKAAPATSPPVPAAPPPR